MVSYFKKIHDMSKLFQALKAGFQEAIEHDQGKLNLRSKFIEIPKLPARYKAKDIKEILTI